MGNIKFEEGDSVHRGLSCMGVRCFVSVDIEDTGLLDLMERVQDRLKGTGADMKAVERENIHLTMRFLGDVREGLLEELKDVVSGIVFDPFRAELWGLGAFPNLRRPRVIWVGITEGVGELEGIFKRLETGLVGMGFRPERRGLSPHITLARVRSGRNRDKLVEQVLEHADEAFGGFEVGHIRLKKSVLTPKGPIYSTLAQSGT
jgi:2'-5' RNA ligase